MKIGEAQIPEINTRNPEITKRGKSEHMDEKLSHGSYPFNFSEHTDGPKASPKTRTKRHRSIASLNHKNDRHDHKEVQSHQASKYMNLASCPITTCLT